MNYDDDFTRGFEEMFQKHLKTVRNFSKESQQKVEENLIKICDFVEEFVDNPNKSADEIELFEKIKLQIPIIKQSIEDMKMILNESLYRQSMAYYENVKKLAKEGNKEAEKIYLDLKPYVEKFDLN